MQPTPLLSPPVTPPLRQGEASGVVAVTVACGGPAGVDGPTKVFWPPSPWGFAPSLCISVRQFSVMISHAHTRVESCGGKLMGSHHFQMHTVTFGLPFSGYCTVWVLVLISSSKAAGHRPSSPLR